MKEIDPSVPEGVYIGVRGPEFESPAEIRAYRGWGADLVGMSTVLEAIAARHAGMEVCGLALVTNPAAGLGPAASRRRGGVQRRRRRRRPGGGPGGTAARTGLAVGAVKALIQQLGLEPIAHEGGWFRQTWRGAEDRAGRPVGTAIIAMFTTDPDGFSAMHRLSATEVWHFYRGDPFVLVLLRADGASAVRTLGPDAEPQVVVPAGTWMGGSVAPGGRWSLLGATMAPGFTDDGFELGGRDELLGGWPDRGDAIRRLTR